jgi:hypothetical protein
MLAAHLCGERVPMRLDSIGIKRLRHLEGRNPWELLDEINVEAGPPIWRPSIAVQALQNLIDAAGREDVPPSAADGETRG